MPTQSLRMLALAVCCLALAGSAAEAVTPTPNPTPNIVYSCSGKINSAVREYTRNVLGYLTECSLNELKGAGCDGSDLTTKLANAAADVSKALVAPGCSDDALFDLCPLDSKTTDPAQLRPKIVAALTGDPPALVAKLQALNDDLFTTAFAGCTRPTTTISSSSPLFHCGEEIASATGPVAYSLESCFFSCERGRIKTPTKDVCVDAVNGDPIATSPSECKASELATVSGVAGQCGDAQIVALGCPLGAHDVATLVSELSARLTTLVQELNLGVYHSDCQGNLPGQPADPVPANVTLEPSLTHTQITCGQTLDSTFFGSDRTVSFDSDLDCGPSRTVTDGVIIAKSGVTLNGRFKTWSISGPSRSSLRTGVGVRLAPGVTSVKINNIKAIQNFGVGIQDADVGNNKRLVIVKTTVRRNVQAGLRLRSPRAKIDTVTADKNGIGMDLSGDGIKVKSSDIKGSVYAPKVGLRLSGVDKNGNGSIVQVTDPLNTVELNGGVGILITEGAHTISNAQIKDNVGAGVQIEALGIGSVLHSNSVKNNADGIVVDGDGNLIEYNTCEQNLGAGFVIGGVGNSVQNNNSGKKTDRGNGEEGYRISGQNVSVQDNSAEANVGSGFVITATGATTLFKGNTSESNFEDGFDIESSGNTFDTCAAEANNQLHPEESGPPRTFHEWVLVAGNLQHNSNKAGGASIGIPSTAGFCDSAADCPLSH